MTEQIKTLLLRLLRVPAEPTPPAGAPESISIFRASRNYYLLNLLKWGFAQVMTFLGIAILFTATWSVDLREATVPLRVIHERRAFDEWLPWHQSGCNRCLLRGAP